MSFASVFSRFHPLPAGERPVQRARGGRRQTRALGASVALAALAALTLPAGAYAQSPGSQDTSFNAGPLGSTVYALAVETIDENERIIVGGDFALENRELPDGTYDVNFEVATFGSPARIVYTAVPQILTGDTDQDKTLLGGLFGKTPKASGAAGTAPALNIVRLNSNGTLDSSFNPGTGANDYVTAILPEANGSIYVGGEFDHFNKIEHHHVVRLNVDGSLDTTFSSSLDINDTVLNVADQIDPATGLPNGQILVVGTFNRVDQTNTAKIARLNSDGTLDTSFNPAIDTRVLTLAVQPDGKIIIGGSFGSVDGVTVQNLARLNQDGTLDTSFVGSITTSPPGTPDETAVYVLKLLPDGRFYAGGNFFSADGVTRGYLARLEPDGSLDTGFDPGSAIINSVQSLGIQTDNEILVGETLSRKINNISPASLIRLFGDPVVAPVIPPPVVTIEATRPAAKEAGSDGAPKNGRFKLARTSEALSSPLTVYLKTGGTAVSGVDYEALKIHKYSGQIYKVTFPAYADILRISVKPTGDTLATSPETVTLTLQPDQGGTTDYTLGSATSATVSISND